VEKMNDKLKVSKTSLKMGADLYNCLYYNKKKSLSKKNGLYYALHLDMLFQTKKNQIYRMKIHREFWVA
jgi:hypothetical protein